MPDVTLHYGSNLSMYNALCKANMPVLKKTTVSYGISSLAFCEPSFPVVLKIGNYHMGYGKALVRNSENWQDFIDMAVLFNEPVSLEPYVAYKTDIRCQYITGNVTCIERKPDHWKANVNPAEVKPFTPPERIIEETTRFADSINADILGLDWIQSINDDWVVLEGNISPGLNDPQKDRDKINHMIIQRLLKKY